MMIILASYPGSSPAGEKPGYEPGYEAGYEADNLCMSVDLSANNYNWTTQ